MGACRAILSVGPLAVVTLSTLSVQEVAFFDEDQHSSGALSARLATDASAVRGAVVSPISRCCESTHMPSAVHLQRCLSAGQQAQITAAAVDDNACLYLQGDQLGLLFQNIVSVVDRAAMNNECCCTHLIRLQDAQC